MCTARRFGGGDRSSASSSVSAGIASPLTRDAFSTSAAWQAGHRYVGTLCPCLKNPITSPQPPAQKIGIFPPWSSNSSADAGTSSVRDSEPRRGSSSSPGRLLSRWGIAAMEMLFCKIGIAREKSMLSGNVQKNINKNWIQPANAKIKRLAFSSYESGSDEASVSKFDGTPRIVAQLDVDQRNEPYKS
jgi:hypothetical protein